MAKPDLPLNRLNRQEKPSNEGTFNHETYTHETHTQEDSNHTADAQPIMEKEPISEQQIKLFFNVLAFVTQNTVLSDELLIDLSAKDRAKVLLAGTIIENCGLADIKNQLQTSAVGFITTHEHWLPIKNQYIFQDHVWLFPVVRACDPSGSVFVKRDSNLELLQSLSNDIGIRMKLENNVVKFDVSRVFQLIWQSQLYASKVGFDVSEIDAVFGNIFGEKGLSCMKLHVPVNINPEPPGGEDFSSAISFLLSLIAIFVATGLAVGYYYS